MNKGKPWKKLFLLLVTLVCLAASNVPMALANDPAQSPAEKLDRVMVRFHSGKKHAVRQALEQQGGRIHYEFDELNVIAVTVPTRAINGLQNNPNVVAVERDALRFALEQTVPYGIDSVAARDLWDANRDGVVDAGAPIGAARTVCIIDSGIHIRHEDFAGISFAGGDPDMWNTDYYGHGTHVAGTIAAMNNETGVVGVTSGGVTLYIVKVYGENGQWTYSSTLTRAAYRCRDAGAHVISMSLGGPTYSSVEDDVFQSLYDQGILSIAAAGNGGGTAYSYPASYASVVSVAAVDRNNVVADFSRRNNQVELAAPGVGVLSTYKDGGYVQMSGTSMATPHVSGVAALVWSANPTWTAAQIRSALQQSALDLGVPGRDVAYGYGLVQAAAALQYLLDNSPPPPPPTPTPPPPPSPPDHYVHISAIDMWYKTAGKNILVYTEVTVVDESGTPVSKATVYLTTTLPDGSTVSLSGSTKHHGTATFRVRSSQTKTYVSEVTDIVHTSLPYYLKADVETNESLTIP